MNENNIQEPTDIHERNGNVFLSRIYGNKLGVGNSTTQIKGSTVDNSSAMLINSRVTKNPLDHNCSIKNINNYLQNPNLKKRRESKRVSFTEPLVISIVNVPSLKEYNEKLSSSYDEVECNKSRCCKKICSII